MAQSSFPAHDGQAAYAINSHGGNDYHAADQHVDCGYLQIATVGSPEVDPASFVIFDIIC